jgi:hypothetical protein
MLLRCSPFFRRLCVTFRRLPTIMMEAPWRSPPATGDAGLAEAIATEAREALGEEGVVPVFHEGNMHLLLVLATQSYYIEALKVVSNFKLNLKLLASNMESVNRIWAYDVLAV